MLKRTLYFGSPCYLSKRLEQLVVNLPNAQGHDDKSGLNTVPIEDIGVVVLDNQQISITQGLIQSLIENNTAIIHCNFSHHPIGLVMPLEANDVQSQRFKVQLDASEPLKKQLWQQVVKAKIENQATLLQTNGKPFATLLGMAKKVRAGDADNQEGQAAVYYWSKVFPENLKFRRGREGEYPNPLLNYGYAILRATVARAIAGAGLMPTLGIHHSNKYNAYCLADDLMEAYRPFVDKTVVEMVTSQEGIELDKTAKQKLLNVITTDVLIANERSPLMNATHRTAASLYRCYAGESRKLLLPKFCSWAL